MGSQSIIERIGAMRLVLVGFTILLYPMIWLTDMEPEGVGILTAYVAPSLVVIMFFLLLLDALMNRVFMIDQEEPQRGITRQRLWLDLAAVAGILLFWWPYFRDIGAL